MSVYNGEKYLAEAIESILNQTYTNFEFIIVNDGSKDSSIDIIKSYMKEDTRIVLIDRENKGLPYSLNEGISVANSSFSWWGAWLNENSQKIVVAPKKWLAINPHNYKWSCENWIEI